jgi:hypothetical protein
LIGKAEQKHVIDIINLCLQNEKEEKFKLLSGVE